MSRPFRTRTKCSISLHRSRDKERKKKKKKEVEIRDTVLSVKLVRETRVVKNGGGSWWGEREREREVGEERPKEVEPPKCDRAEERQTVAGTRSVQLGQVMSRHARGFMPLSVELPRTFQVDPVSVVVDEWLASIRIYRMFEKIIKFLRILISRKIFLIEI